jgi:hypothetical protein
VIASEPMAVSGGASKALAFGVGVGLVAALVLGWHFSERRAHETGAEREAQSELVRLGLGIAKCSAGDVSLPETSERVPARLADVAGKSYASQDGDFRGAAFACAKFSARPPQRLQYRWVKEGKLGGRAEARADVNADGVPDRWFEIRVECTPEGCQAANYPHEVLSDGTRVPPGLLGLLGRAKAVRGEPPSLLPDDAPRGVGMSGGEAPASPPPPPPVIAAGAPLALDTLFFESERRAAAKLPGSVLFELSLRQVRGSVAQPSEGTQLSALYGLSDAKGMLAKGERALRVVFDEKGLSDAFEPSPRPLQRIGFADCLPGQLIGTLPSSPEPRTLTLSWDAKRGRALWRVNEKSAPQRSYGADRCALVK